MGNLVEATADFRDPSVVETLRRIMNEQNPKLAFEICQRKNIEYHEVLMDSIKSFTN